MKRIAATLIALSCSAAIASDRIVFSSWEECNNTYKMLVEKYAIDSDYIGARLGSTKFYGYGKVIIIGCTLAGYNGYTAGVYSKEEWDLMEERDRIRKVEEERRRRGDASAVMKRYGL